MANIVKRKTLILQSTTNKNKTITYQSGTGDVYVNSYILRTPGSSESIPPINGYFVFYFSSGSKIIISVDGEEYTYSPVDYGVNADSKKMKYKRLDMMIDDDTSYSILRVNPKLTGNVKVVVDSDSNLYLDTFKVSLGLSQNKYRHLPLNPSEYYGRTLMAKMKSMPTDDFYKIEDSCYDLFATANDFDEQYYDKYNYGVRTNTDKMYTENYSLLAPLCIRKNLPDFFLIFKIINYEGLFNDNNIDIQNRTDFLDLDNCKLVKSFDFREGTNLGTYVRTILENNKTAVGDVYTGYDYNHFNIFNGISLDRGVVANIYEETTPERTINNQVAMNDWYTLGFQRNHIVSKDIINFEFMFDDTSEPLFSLPTYFGIYVRLNGENETFTCIDVNQSGAVFDSSIHGTDIGSYFDPKSFSTAIYGISTPESFVRLHNNVKDDQETKKHKLETYKSIITVDTYDISEYNDGNWQYVSNKLNDVLDPGEHYRVIIPGDKKIYEVIASNYFDDNELSEISYSHVDVLGDEVEIQRIAILNVEYRSNIDEKDKADIIKSQLKSITKAFNLFGNEKIRCFNDGESSFSLVYNSGSYTVYFEKISSICGFNNTNDDIIKDENNPYNDNSSYIFGTDQIEKMIIDPNTEGFDDSFLKIYYPIGFESLGTRVAYCVYFKKIIYNINSDTMVLVSDDIQKSLSSYKTVLYNTQIGENKIFKKNVNIKYIITNGIGVSSQTTDNVYDIVGFGQQKSYMTIFDKTPFIKNNQKMQLYQNFPMNVGLCSIFPLKDYYFDVLDQNSVFFVKNENNEEESTQVDGKKSEYNITDTNAYGKSIINNSEEFVADYCDKFETYNVDTSGKGYMVLETENDLGQFLSNMQSNGHNKFDISLISPYCCKWRILGTDMTGNRMRVMYNLRDDHYKIYSYDSSTWKWGYLQSDGSIRVNEFFTTLYTSPFIDISEDKDISFRFNSGSSFDIWYVGYYVSEVAAPTSVTGFYGKLDSDLIASSNFIRFTIDKRQSISIIVSKSYGDKPFLLRGENSYWIPSDDETHIGFISYDFDCDDEEHKNSRYTKYISNEYDEDETGSFNYYIYNGNGSIDDLLYRLDNYVNKFSKLYKYGDNSVEFVSCGVKVRIKSTDKSIVNLSRYIGYSIILLCMSGNNANQPGTYEVFIDEVKEQIALVVYNGISSDNNRISYQNTDPGIYRIKHSIKLSDSIYEVGVGLKIKDDGYIFDVSTGLIGANVTLVSKPTKNEQQEESVNNKQLIISGKIKEINDDFITIENSYRAIDGTISIIEDQQDINSLLLPNSNNNVDAYIDTDIIRVNSLVSTHSLSLNQLKNLTSLYAITIKTINNTKKYNDIASILSIDLVEPFELKRENVNYEIVTSGLTHPSYAVPVMKDIFKFEYEENEQISDDFKTWFNGCNIILKDVDVINQTWMKKVIDIDNVMKQKSFDSSTILVKTNVKYEITEIPNTGEYFTDAPENGEVYKEKIGDSSYGYMFRIDMFTEGEHDDVVTNTYEIRNQELVVEPGATYPDWRSSTHTLKYENFGTKYLTPYNEYYEGSMVIKNIGVSGNEKLSINEKMSYVTNILSGIIDASSNTSILTGLSSYNDTIICKGEGIDPITLYFDNKIEGANNETRLQLRTANKQIKITDGTDLNSLYLVKNSSDSSDNALKFDPRYTPNYQPEGESYSIHFTIKNIKTETERRYKNATVKLISDDITAKLERIINGTLVQEGGSKIIRYQNAKSIDSDTDPKTINENIIDQSHSVTLLRHQDPLIGYWYTNMCRLFSKYDTYVSYYGAFSGFEKNSYIASRGITLKSKDSDGNIKQGFILSEWVDSIIDKDNGKITLNITASIINFINNDTDNGYSQSWNKNQQYINSESVSYAPYKSKYIENTILNLIDINNNTKFVLYVDKSVDDLEFNDKKPVDTSQYEEVKNLKNTLVFSENRYYMNIENLEPHSYYAEMIINF